MQDEGYNGWTNWDTWNAHLWLSNHEASYHAMRRVAHRITTTFRMEAEAEIRAMGNPDGIDLANVDWAEVQEAFAEDE